MAVADPELRVVIADDHPATRTALRRNLSDSGFQVVAETADASAAVEAVRSIHPEVALLDIHMPGNGIAAADEISRLAPDVAIVMLTVSRTDEDLFDALKAGARGYLLKDMDPERLPAALRAVLAGEAALPRKLLTRVIDEFHERDTRRVRKRLPSNARLSSREWQVAEALERGLTTNEIAELLFISDTTVRTHVASILHKLRVSSRDEAVRVLREDCDR